MSEEEIKAALSIEVEECGDMCGTWMEIKLMWHDEVISTTKTTSVSNYED